MKCPFGNDENFDCPYMDTSEMTKEMECNECPFYKKYIEAESIFMMSL